MSELPKLTCCDCNKNITAEYSECFMCDGKRCTECQNKHNCLAGPAPKKKDETKKPDLPDAAVKLVNAITKPPLLAKKEEIEATIKGELVGDTLEKQYRLARYYCKSGSLPKGYDTPEKVLTGMQYARELGLKPLSALRNLAFINGQPTLWGEMPFKMIRDKGVLVSVDDYWIDKDYKRISVENKNINAIIFAAICTVQRTEHEKKTFWWSAEEQERSKLGVKDIWHKFYRIMMTRKARGLAAKLEFGDIIGGAQIAEYDYGVIVGPGDNIEVSRSADKQNVDELNKRFESAKEI